MINGSTETKESNVLDGAFKVTIESQGVFLTVCSPKDGGSAITEAIILFELKKKQIDKFDYELVIKTVEEGAGKPIKIAESKEVAGKQSAEPEIRILISRDRMEAFLEITTSPGGRPVNKEEIINRITKAGIVYGISQEAIAEAIKSPNIKIICAKGSRQIDGTKAVIKYCVSTEDKGRPVEDDDGRVDYKNINMFTLVNAGDILAEKIPATPGIAGSDVLGQVINARQGKDIPFPIGKNVQIDGDKIISTIAGQLIIANNKVNVLPLIEIKNDIDLSTGNIEFNGSVVIHGSVQAGFTVKATGNVEIAGTVSGGTIEGKNVVVRMGIQGMHRGYVKAEENVVAKFIENAVIYAGNDIIVNNVILHSTVYANKKELNCNSKLN